MDQTAYLNPYGVSFRSTIQDPRQPFGRLLYQSQLECDNRPSQISRHEKQLAIDLVKPRTG